MIVLSGGYLYFQDDVYFYACIAPVAGGMILTEEKTMVLGAELVPLPHCPP
jgi:hypothetical protein